MTGPALDIDIPDGDPVVAVLLHPHPDMGGNRFNHVVGTLFRALPVAGIGAVRFDFSSSDLDVATAEAVAALDAAGGLPVVVVGYSFGAMVASRVADDRVAGWFLVAPPIDHVDAAVLGADPRPKGLAVPEHDFSPPAHVAEVTAPWRATELEVVAGADHFLGVAAPAVADRVVAWMRGHGWA